MIHLSNGAQVHAAYVVPSSMGMKDNGVVLAETAHDWVVWNIYWDKDYTRDHEGNIHECWEAESGHYFPHTDEGRRLAENQFGLSLARVLFLQTSKAISLRVQQATGMI